MKPVAWVPRLVHADDEAPVPTRATTTPTTKPPATAQSLTPTSSSGDKPDVLRLQEFLKREQLVASGGEAKHAIQEGKVTINGVVDTRRKRQLQVGDVVAYAGKRAVVAATSHS